MKFFYIAINAVREIVREPVFLITTLCLIYLCGLTPFFASFAFGEHVRLIRDGAFAYHLMLGLVAGSVAASTAIFREIGKGSADAILSKPVGKALFFLSKFCGVTVALLMFSLIAALSTVLSVRIGINPYKIDGLAGGAYFSAPFVAMAFAALLNFKYRKPFASSAFFLLIAAMLVVFVWALSADWLKTPAMFGTLWDFRMAPQSLLITIAIITLAAIAISLSVRMRPELTLMICAVLLFAGLLSDYFFGRFLETSRTARLVYYILPNWQHYWVVDALVDGGSIPPGYVAVCFLYASLYITAVLSLGVVSFSRRQME